MFSVEDKVIIVTGGKGLLGNEIISRLKKAGAIAISADIDTTSENENEIFIDITDETSVGRAIKQTVNKFGKIDGWVNNAYPRTRDWGNKLEDIPFASWQKNVDMHLNGYFLCARTVLEQMKLQRAGSLVNMASIYGEVAPDFTVYEGTDMTMPAAYAAIKGGVINLTRYLAAYYGPFELRVNSVSPGGIFDGQNETFVSNYNKKVPLKRMGMPGDVASSVHFLLSNDSAYITGHNLLVDGGWSIV
jgi:NAD(P)-dependent dehydrogenase (short-subunit alcohol dehydrogenase family)